MDLNRLSALPKKPPVEFWEAMAWITTDKVERVLKNHPELKKTQESMKQRVSRHVLDDVPNLERWGVFEEGTITKWSVEIPIFKVPKSGNVDARLIGDARELNRLLPRPGDMHLPDIRTVLSKLLSYNFLHQLDAKSYFYQFPLHSTLRDILVTRCGGRRGTLLKTNNFVY